MQCSRTARPLICGSPTDKARRWIKKHVEFSQAQFWGEALVVEWRYIEGLVLGMRNDGLEVHYTD